MKKSVIILASIFSVVILSSLVAAQMLPAPPIAMRDVTNFFSNLLVGIPYQMGVFARVMLVLLITIILLKPAEKIVGTERSGLALMVALIVSILGIRFIPVNAILGLLLPYGVLAVALSALIPFLLFAGFISTSDLQAWVRKTGWTFFGVVFLGFWWTRFSEIGDLAWIYLFGAIACFTMLFFFDSEIHKLWYMGRLKRKQAVAAGVQAEILAGEIKGLYSELAKAGTDAQRSSLKDEVSKKEKNLKALLEAESRG